MIGKILFANFYNLYIEFFLAQFILLFNAKKRSHFWYRFAIGFAAGFGFYWLPPLNWLDFNWSYTVVFLSIVIVGFFLYDCSFGTYLVCSIMGYALQHLTWNTMELFFETAYPNEDLLSRGGAITYYLTFFIVFYTVAFLIVWKKKVFVDFVAVGPYTIIASVVTLMVSVVLSEKVTDWNYIYRLYSIVSALLAILVVFGAFNLSKNQKKQIELEKNNVLLQKLIMEKSEQQVMAKETIDIINMKAHDMKNQLSVLANLNSEEKDRYVESINETIDIYNDIAKTGNEVLDIVLTQKSLLCTSKNIKFTYICDGTPFANFDPMDITALFANIIDNAIEAVSKESDERNRIIKFNASEKGGFICIHSENYCDTPIKFDSDGLPVTTKEDKLNHGLGVKSISYLANKYNGNATFSWKENIFSANVLIPVEADTN